MEKARRANLARVLSRADAAFKLARPSCLSCLSESSCSSRAACGIHDLMRFIANGAMSLLALSLLAFPNERPLLLLLLLSLRRGNQCEIAHLSAASGAYEYAPPVAPSRAAAALA